ncbi:hypothetical protein [Treponema endosymbiont of Eucomonympha sp.]|nr:hypothetical protein [Treponema endosymbiont of Eucomonympha sp.]
MNIWVFNKPPQDIIAFIHDSLKSGISRFGWGWFDSADLHALKTRAWQEYNKDEKEAWHRTNFLLGIEPGDWIVHVNMPQWGTLTPRKSTVLIRLEKILHMVISATLSELAPQALSHSTGTTGAFCQTLAAD